MLKFAKKYWKLIIVILFICSIVVFNHIFNISDKVINIKTWINDFGIWSPVIFGLVYIIATMVFLPSLPIALLAGGLFGSVNGIIIISIASTLGAAITFAFSRYFLREYVTNLLSNNEKFNRLDSLTEKYGAVIVGISRLIPILPFCLLNYSFGITRVKFGVYVFWSWICMLPATIVYVISADMFVRSVGHERVSFQMIAALSMGIIIFVLMINYAARKLKEKEKGISAE